MRAPAESFSPTIGVPLRAARSIACAILRACILPRLPPATVPSPGASTCPSPSIASTNTPSSWKLPLSSSRAIRSRAVAFPASCCRSIRTCPPPRAMRLRRSSISAVSSWIRASPPSSISEDTPRRSDRIGPIASASGSAVAVQDDDAGLAFVDEPLTPGELLAERRVVRSLGDGPQRLGLGPGRLDLVLERCDRRPVADHPVELDERQEPHLQDADQRDDAQEPKRSPGRRVGGVHGAPLRSSDMGEV